MDVLVEWRNGTRNIVSKKDLKLVNEQEKIKEGTEVKMLYKNKWYYGVVIDYDCSDDSDLDISDSDELRDYVSLAKLKTDFLKKKNSDVNKTLIDFHELEEEIVDDPEEYSALFSGSENDDSFVDPNFSIRCQIKRCKNEGTENCSCNQLVCKKHYKAELCGHAKSDSDTSIDEKYESPRKKKKHIKRKIKPLKPLKQQIFHHKESDNNAQKDLPPEVNPTCETKRCEDEIFAACVKCLALLCFKHFDEDDLCSNHNTTSNEEIAPITKNKTSTPEDFAMEGSLREEPRPKKQRVNKQKLTKERRNTGQGYTQHNKSYNLVAPKCIRERCKGEACKRQGKKCCEFTEDDRKKIFDAFYGMGDLTLQREYIGRYAVVEQKKRCLVKSDSSRRQNTVKYSLPLVGIAVPVCKVFIINTLAVSEKSVRTSLENIQKTGVLEPEKRGGRYPSVIEKDKQLRQAIIDHINKFDRVESHYVRSHSAKEYLHEDLNISKMYRMFCEEHPNETVASITTYAKVFNEVNLSFHRPKKDKCTLCTMYLEGDESVKKSMEEKYKSHIEEKVKIREIKSECKRKSIKDKSVVAAVSDLQQVIYLPKTNESAVFYKRRLAVFNFTIYDLSTKDCHCYTWHETVSRRGASEMSSCVFLFLMEYAKQGAKVVNLFCDGCAGQNKNTIIVAMMLYTVNNSPIEILTLRFFEPYHGQSEGDSAHSAIGYAIKKAGDLYLPSQLLPIMTLARSKDPYKVNQMNSEDFVDFKHLSKELKILKVRKDNESGKEINWTEVVEVSVKKSEPRTIFFKTSHLQQTSRSITLKRALPDPLKTTVRKLNKESIPLAAEKHKDLMSLCEGQTPVIRNVDHVNYYKALPHC